MIKALDLMSCLSFATASIYDTDSIMTMMDIGNKWWYKQCLFNIAMRHGCTWK